MSTTSTRWLTGAVGFCLALCALTTTTAWAQDAATLSRFRASPTPEDDFHLSRPTDLGHLRYGVQLHADYANDPLVWLPSMGPSSRIVAHQLNLNLGFSLGLFDRVVVFAGLPVTPLMSGDSDEDLAARGLVSPDGAGLGNAYLGARVRLFGERDDAFALGLQLIGTFPTAGGDQRFRGEDFLTFRPELLAEIRPGAGARIVLNAGAIVRRNAQTTGSNLVFSDELTFGLGFAVPIFTAADDPRTHLDLHAQIYGSTAFNDFFGRDQTALEATGGLKFFHQTGVVAGLAAGPGITRGFGSPDVRVIAMLGYARPTELAREPQAVGDRDGDGIPDDRDQCPDEAEDFDGFEDADGCPDPDNDGDGLLDEIDRCPNEAGPAANQGCPDTDRDSDGVVDRLDNCPDEPGSPENQGCPTAQLVRIEEGRLQILDVVYFATNRDVIQRRSFPLLENVARVLNAHPEIRRVRVEGHTDSRGRREANVDLSQRRAEAVVRFLIDRGEVDAGRLEAQGYGPDRPIVENARSNADHAQNRRVEFNIVGSGTN
ncbi:MAG: OmpA family protein [Myxococcales bacterium]|nr:OmpA family protein [Myxococcales bacterium]